MSALSRARSLAMCINTKVKRNASKPLWVNSTIRKHKLSETMVVSAKVVFTFLSSWVLLKGVLE